MYAFSFECLLAFKTTSANAMPISKYSSDHTGPNTQFGGLRAGFSRVAYHEGIFETVASEPIAPAAKDAAIDKANTIIFLIMSLV